MNRDLNHFVIIEKLGLSLRNFYEMEQLSLGLPDLVKIGIELIERVREIHSLGLIHGDIKPDNIMLGNYQHLLFQILTAGSQNN